MKQKLLLAADILLAVGIIGLIPLNLCGITEVMIYL